MTKSTAASSTDFLPGVFFGICSEGPGEAGTAEL
jgi:hypothetical protein